MYTPLSHQKTSQQTLVLQSDESDQSDSVRRAEVGVEVRSLKQILLPGRGKDVELDLTRDRDAGKEIDL